MRFFKQNLKNSRLIRLISYCLLWVIILTTLLSIISSFGWNNLLELFSHFKLQYFLLNLFLLSLLLLTRRQKIILISLSCVAISLAEILPWYIPQARIGGTNSIQLRVLSANVNIQNPIYSKVLSLVRQEKPDIAIFMEIDRAWAEQLDSLKDILPHSLVNANPYNLGIAVYSKHKLEDASIAFFGVDRNPTILTRLNVNGQTLSLIATHPPPPIRKLLFHARNQQLNEIAQYIKSLSTRVIVAGDLNITMWSPYYKRFVNQTKLDNARQGFGLVPTWPLKTSYPPYSKIPSFLTDLLSIPIDHCLMSPDIEVANIRGGPNVGSDHRPLITDLIIPESKS